MTTSGTSIGPLLAQRETHLPVNEVFGPTVQGEGPHTGRAVSFVRLGLCNLSCQWCMTPDMLIMRPDFTYTPAGDLQVGDKVLGRTSPEKGKHGKLVESTVTNTFRRQSPLVRVNGNLTCAAGTRFWVSRNRNARSGWREVERCEGLECIHLAEPMKRDQGSYELGYLAGVADGDGCFWDLRAQGKATYRRFRLAMNDQGVLDRTRQFAANQGFDLRPGKHSYSGHIGGRGSMPCLWLTNSAEASRFERALVDSYDDESWRWGYLAGIFDAEGSLSSGHILRIAQYKHINGVTYDRIADTATRLGFRVEEEPKGVRLRTSNGDLWRFLVGATPAKRCALDRATGRAPNNSKVIRSVDDAGHGEVVSLTTSTGNYIAEGWLVHNCDSASTWDDSRYDLAAWNPSTPVSSVVKDVAQRGAPVTVLSGGEPLMQQTRPAFTTMLDGLASISSVHVETNGTISPTRHVADRVSWFSVSPKLANNGSDPVGKRLKSSVLARFASLADQRRACFKFVINNPSDLDEVDALARELSLAPDQVWIMPEGISPESVLARHRRLAEHIITRGYSTSTRLHTLMWGDERGR